MRIVVFSGTTEGRDFSRAAAALGIAVTVSVATDLGAEEQGQAPGITVHSGRLLPGAMAELLQGAALCVDATHPYAVEATKNIRAAANAAGVEYHRLLRAASTLPAGSVVLGSAAQAAQYLAATQGNVLLTTGAKVFSAVYIICLIVLPILIMFCQEPLGKLVNRQKDKNNGFKLTYEAELTDRTEQETLEEWLRRERQWQKSRKQNMK